MPNAVLGRPRSGPTRCTRGRVGSRSRDRRGGSCPRGLGQFPAPGFSGWPARRGGPARPFVFTSVRRVRVGAATRNRCSVVYRLAPCGCLSWKLRGVVAPACLRLVVAGAAWRACAARLSSGQRGVSRLRGPTFFCAAVAGFSAFCAVAGRGVGCLSEGRLMSWGQLSLGR